MLTWCLWVLRRRLLSELIFGEEEDDVNSHTNQDQVYDGVRTGDSHPVS